MFIFIFTFNQNYKEQGKIVSLKFFKFYHPFKMQKLIEQDIINKTNQSNAEYLVLLKIIIHI